MLAFQENSGTVIFYGQSNNAEIKDNKLCSVESILKVAKCVSSKENLIDALEPWRQLDIRGTNGKRRNIYLHQFRQDGKDKWLFIAQAYTGMLSRERTTWDRRGLHEAEQIKIRIKGHWQVERYDTISGTSEILESTLENTDTIVHYPMYGDDSLLLRLSPVVEEWKDTGETTRAELEKENRKNALAEAEQQPEISEKEAENVPAENGSGRQVQISRISAPVGYTLSEPNALLLDKFSFSLDGGPEEAESELLKIDNVIRKRLGYPLRMESVEQPYVRKEDTRDHLVRLRVTFESMIEIAGCRLALEERGFSKVIFNGDCIDMKPQGYYVDKAIETLTLPMIQKGENELVVEMQYGRGTNLEWMYILGDFGVQVYGSEKIITEKPKRLYWGDYTRQGFPFYTGNMTYYVKVNVEKQQKIRLEIPYFAGAAIKVTCAGNEKLVAFLPYACELEGLPEGENILQITCLGNRFNGFGQLHMIGNDLTWVGPDSWRTENESWTDTYRLKEMGILSEPLIYDVL